MSSFQASEDNEDTVRYECPACGKGFDVAGADKWSGEGLLCPYCGTEIDV